MPPTGRNTSAISRPTARATSISISIRCGHQSNIDAIGIDLYWPLADWRDGRDHLDALAGATSIYDPAYLRAQRRTAAKASTGIMPRTPTATRRSARR